MASKQRLLLLNFIKRKPSRLINKKTNLPQEHSLELQAVHHQSLASDKKPRYQEVLLVKEPQSPAFRELNICKEH